LSRCCSHRYYGGDRDRYYERDGDGYRYYGRDRDRYYEDRNRYRYYDRNDYRRRYFPNTRMAGKRRPQLGIAAARQMKEVK
jgi:hypothetical protein